MKKLAFAILVLYSTCILVSASPGYEPGIKGDSTAKKGEYVYSEVVFLSGEPILMTGTINVSEDTRGIKTKLVYKLTNSAKNAKLDRTVTFINSAGSSGAGSQTTYSTTVDPGYKETVGIGSDTFRLTSYHFSRSGINDDKSVIQYLVSNWNGEKVYSRNDGAGEVVLDISSEQYSYDNFWSSTETAMIKTGITYRYKENTNSSSFKETYGTAEYAVSNSNLKTMEYMVNDPRDISFTGGYILKEGQENVVSYTYDTPAMSSGRPTSRRNKGSDSYKLTTVPIQSRLFAQTIRDISDNYWAAEDIKKVVSMDIISMASGAYFRPLGFMSRGEFAKAMVKASSLESGEERKPAGRTYAITYNDVDKNHPYFDYINTATKFGIMNGTSQNRFSPDEYLTKAQAASIIVRAMGLEESSGASSTATSFRDDGRVPAWAKKAINVAHEMGIITGNQNNEIEPDKILTRAESAAMINRFIKYLQYDIRKEYREKLIDYGR